MAVRMFHGFHQVAGLQMPVRWYEGLIIESRSSLGELVPMLKRLDEQCFHLSGLLVLLVDYST